LLYALCSMPYAYLLTTGFFDLRFQILVYFRHLVLGI
jgi:hypothetical protein